MALFTRVHSPRRRRLGNFEPLESRRLLAVSPAATAAREEAERASGGCPLCGAAGCFEHLGDDGTVMMACHFDAAAALVDIEAAADAAADLQVAALDDTFLLHSNPAASKVIYLDFDGHVTSGTKWRNGTTFTNEAYSFDADFETFNDEERRAIQNIWARVAEDFIPFDVDVTTEEPPLADLIKSGANDTRWGIRVVVGGDWADAAGIAYVGSFNWNSDTPAFVFAGKWWKSQRNTVATAISHEAGHTLGLGHDGYNGNAYYGGRGTGETSWGPIMGGAGSKSLTQWSKGEYTGATNRQDDLDIITTRNGFGYRPDDHGDTLQTATGATAVGPVTLSGIIGTSDDVDTFRFTTGGSVDIAIDPIASGTNLDVLAELLDADGTVVATSNPADEVAASFSTTVTPGTYYVAVRGSGAGNGVDTGYTTYGSLGQYTVSLVNDTINAPTLSITNASIAESDSGTVPVEVRVVLSTPAIQPVTVAYATIDATAKVADGDYLPALGALSFDVGERVKTFTILVRGDTKLEDDERVTVQIADARGAAIARSQAAVMILDDDSPPAPEVIVLEVPAGQTVADSTVRSGGRQLVKRGAGTLILDLANNHAGGTVVEEGEVVVRHEEALGGGGLQVGAGTTVRLDIGSGGVAVSRLDLAVGAILDLGTGRITIAPGGADPAAVREWIRSGQRGGIDNGVGGIASSAAAAAPAGSRTVGIAIGADGSATVAYAAPGDTDLDGRVNVFDLVTVNGSGSYQRPGTASVWSEGDFNGDGATNVFDLVDASVSGAYNAGSYLVTPAEAAASPAAAAEPLPPAGGERGGPTSAPLVSSQDRGAAFARLAAAASWETLTAEAIRPRKKRRS